jgi:regulator of sirC expression with transglutaminase-like and TPR domain
VSDTDQTRRALAALVASDETRIDLARAALLIALEEYPRLDIEAHLARLDRLGQTLRERIGSDRAPARHIAALNTLLFDQQGFRGNAEDYYDPRNSYLNDVLDRRLGIPITLSVVYVEVGRRAGLPLGGVGFPAHFLVAYATQPRLFVDPFNRGRILSAADCQALLQQMFGKVQRLEPWFLAESSPREILARMLANLKAVYEQAGDLQRAQRVSEQMSVVQPSPTALQDRTLIHQLRERRN